MFEHRPQTDKEVVELLSGIHEQGILLRCGGHASSRGVSPGKTQAILNLSDMNKITRLDPNDLTCGVQAGVLLEDLEEALAPHGLAFESGPFLGHRSIGGILGEAPPASRSFDRGRLRSQLIGILGVDGRGRRFHAGGQVVKNVAGYDLCKLFVGSGGAYFVGLEFQLRLVALPARIGLLQSEPLGLDDGIIQWRELRNTLPTPRALDLVLEGSHCHIEVLLGGSAAYVESQIRHTGFKVKLEGMDAWKGVRGREAIANKESSPPNLFRGHCPPSQLSDWIGQTPIHGRIHYQGAFEWDRLPGGERPMGAIVHPTQREGEQVQGNPPSDPGACRIAMELKRTFAGGLMPQRLSFLTRISRKGAPQEIHP